MISAIMDAQTIVAAIRADIEKNEKDDHDLERQAAGIAAKREKLAEERAELRSAMQVIMRKVAAAGGTAVVAVGMTPEEIVREALREAGHSLRTPELAHALTKASKVPPDMHPSVYAGEVAAAAGLVSEGRGWWRFPTDTPASAVVIERDPLADLDLDDDVEPLDGSNAQKSITYVRTTTN